MSDIEFEQVFDLALRLSPAEQERLIQQLRAATQEALTAEDDAAEIEPSWTDEEIADLMKITPKTGAEIVASGVLGGWEHKGITDSAEWVNEQKRKRKESRRW